MAYMIEGKGTKTWARSKGWLFGHPEASHDLLDLITTLSITYLVEQVKAGAQLLQVFESWAGDLSEDCFNTFSLPYLKRIASEVKAELKKQGVPTVPMVVFAKGAHYALESLAKTEYDVIQIDWTVDPADARKRVGPSKTLQGNMYVLTVLHVDRLPLTTVYPTFWPC